MVHFDPFRSTTIASHLASIPVVLRGSRMANRAYHKCVGNKCMMGMDRDYFPLPTDEAYDNDSDEYDDYEEGEGKDLLEERDLRTSPSCVVQ